MRDPVKTRIERNCRLRQRIIIDRARRNIQYETIIANKFFGYEDVRQITLQHNVWDTIIVEQPPNQSIN